MYARTLLATRASSIAGLGAPGYSRRVEPVAVRILHPAPTPAAGLLERALTAARGANAERLVARFRAAGADDVRIETGPPDRLAFGARLRALVDGLPRTGLPRTAGLVVLGSGSIPLAGRRDVSELVEVAASGERRALANSFYSADVVAIGGAAALASVPDLASDNALPRWLAEAAGYEVADRRRRWRLAVDLDSPLDAVLLGLPLPPEVDTGPVAARIERVRSVAADPRAELVIAGRTSSSALRWIERSTASRTRALVEERGLRTSAPGSQRPPRSALGLVLDARGPEALGAVLAELGDAALIDSRVLLAHRLGPDEASWPAAEDRFAADLLLPEGIRDPWLRALATAAREAVIPVLLGGHTLVGPGLRLLLGGRR
jgi:hypothetical protein